MPDAPGSAPTQEADSGLRVIGIDPDLRKSGVAVVVSGRIEALYSLDFFQLQNLIDGEMQAVFLVEDVESNLPVFNRRLTVRQNLKVAQDVGRVKGVARLIFEYLIRCNRQYLRVKPLKGHLKKCKTDASRFQQLTGWKHSSNGDQRDAALLALYGIRPNQVIADPAIIPF